MSDLFAYLFEASLCLLVGWGVYRVLFHERAHFSFNRRFLLGVTALAVVLPAVHVPRPALFASATGNLAAVLGQRMQVLPELVVNGTHTATDVPWGWALGMLYAGGAAAVAAVLLLRLYRLWQLHRLPGEVTDGYRLVRLPHAGPTFTFLNRVYQHEEPPLTPSEQRAVLVHEAAHVRERHSLDVLWINVLKIPFWFHPVIYRLDRNLRAQHEYLADRAVVNTQSTATYVRLLARQQLDRSGFVLSHDFSAVQPQTRIHMLHQKTVRPARRRTLLSLAVLFLLTLYVACEQEQVTESPVTESTAVQAENALHSLYRKYDFERADYKLIYNQPEAGAGSAEVLLQNTARFSAGDRRRAEKLADVMAEELSKEMQGKLSDVDQARQTDAGDEIFLVVEHQAEPVGGIKAFFDNYMSGALRYPGDARTQGVEGRVFVEFVVEKDGSLSNVKTLKSPHPALSAEAERVMRASPPWQPGKQADNAVRVRMVMPIAFKLGD